MKNKVNSVELSSAEIERVRKLRKVDPDKAHKLFRRLKEKHKKTEKRSKDVPQIRLPTTEEENQIENTGLLDASDDVTEDIIIENDFEQLGEDDENVEQLLQVYKRFVELDETRAAGKIGNGESLIEFNEGRVPVPEKKIKKDDFEEIEDDEDFGPPRPTLSKKKIKQMRRPTISYLKMICTKPEVVEAWDTTAPNPELLVFLKALRNTVVVPGHWSHKRRYLQGKRGIERSQFALPDYIEATRISEIRSAIEAKDSRKTLKQKMRDKIRGRHKKISIDYQVLHDAFFKHASKPNYTKFGDVYFEGKETEMHFRKYTPGKLSERCRDALGMISALNAPPWLLNMQRYGPPPSYPNLVVPGVNAHIPDGAAFGYQPGGWGKSPSLEQLKIWGVTPHFEKAVLGEDEMEGLERGGELALWGALQTVESEDEEELETGDIVEDIESQPEWQADGETIESGIATPQLSSASYTSGIQSSDISFGFQTPQSVDLRKTDFLAEPTAQAYKVLEQKKAPTQPSSLFSSEMIYVIPETNEQQEEPFFQS